MKNKILVLTLIAVLCFPIFVDTVSALNNSDLIEKKEDEKNSDSTKKLDNKEKKELENSEKESKKEDNLKLEEVKTESKEGDEAQTIESQAENEITEYPDLIKGKNVKVEAFGRGDPNSILSQEQRNMSHSSLETTGLYLPRGEELVVYVEGDEDPKNLSVAIGLYGEYDTEKLDLEKGSPGMAWTNLVKGENRINRPNASGLVYIENKNNSGSIHVEISGGLQIPRFKLGVTSRESFIEQVEMYSEYVPFFELEGEYSLSAFQISELKNLPYQIEGRLELVVNYWDEVVIKTNEHYGFNNEAGGVAKKNTNQRIYIANPDTGAGYAYATSGYVSFQIDTGASKDLLKGLPTENQWGFWHEVGHTYQNKYYTFNDHTEVTVNLSANALNKKFLNEDRTTGSKNNIKNYFSKPIETRVYTELSDLFVKLSMFWSLQRVFGDTFYQRVNQFYRTMDSSLLPQTNDEKYQVFIMATSEVAQRNLTQYFREWGIPVDAETEDYCSQFAPIEKEIWKDIAGLEERFELLDILGPYTVPKAITYTLDTPIFTPKEDILVSDFSSVPMKSDTTVLSTSYSDIGGNKGAITLINEERVRNNIPITNVTGGDAVRFFGNDVGIQVIAPNSRTKQFQVVGKSGKFHGSWGGSLYASIKQYSSEGLLKREALINGNDSASGIKKMFNNTTYEIGDVIEIYHAESHTRLSRYKENNLLSQDTNRKYWYKMTEKGWEEIDATPSATFIEDQFFMLTEVLKAEDLVKDVKGLYPASKVTARFESEPVLMDVGKKEVTIIVSDNLASELKVKGIIEVVGGDAVQFVGNASGVQVIAPNPATKLFQVVGKSGNFHGTWGGSLYASIKQYSSAGLLKREALINGNDNSSGIKNTFNNAIYEIGDIIEIYHAESHNRLSRYKENILLSRDTNRKYWYKMTEKGWEEIDATPSVSFIEGQSFRLTEVLKAEDLVTDIKGMYPASEVTVRFESEPVLMEVGEKEVSIIVEDSLAGQLKLKGKIEVVGGDAIRFFGNSTGIQVIAPNPSTKQFQVVGVTGRFHSGWTGDIFASLKHYSSEGLLKRESVIYGENDSKGMKATFNNQPYEIGDLIQVFHVESGNRLDRYKDSIELKRDSNKTYWYEMTNEGWNEISTLPQGEFIEDKIVKLTTPINASDLVKDAKGFYPNSEITVRFDKEPDLLTVGEKNVTIIIEDQDMGQKKLTGSFEVVGGDAVHMFADGSGVQVIAPNPETNQFQLIGKSGKFHKNWAADKLYVSIKQYSAQKEIKREALIYGTTDSGEIQTIFKDQPYEVGDIVEIYHAESLSRLNRYQDNILLEKDGSKYYRYEMTTEGWKPIEYLSEFEFEFSGEEENATATVVKYNGSKTEVEIPDTAINFKDGWFKETTVVAIGDSAFTDTKFVSVSIPGSIKKIGTNAFRWLGTLTTVYFHEGLEEIGSSAFDNTKVSGVVLPTSLKFISNGAFTAADISEVIIPENVEEMGKNAFRSNGSITEVTILSDKIEYGINVFSNSQVGIIYAPRDKLETIKGQLTSTVMADMKDNDTHLRAIEDYKDDARVVNKAEREQIEIELTDEYRFDTKNASRWTLDTPNHQVSWYKDNDLIKSGVGASVFTINEIMKADAGTYHAERNDRKLESIFVSVNQGGLFVPPLDPTNTGNPNIPREEMNPDAEAFSILFVSPLAFESVKQKNIEQIIYGTTRENTTPIITVQDFRTNDERTGWELYIRQTTNFRDGATLQMTPFIHEDYKENLKINTSTEKLIIGVDNQQFAKTTVANPKSGVVTMGMSNPDKKGVQLIIPNGSGIGEYRTTLVWELVSSP